MPKGKTVIPVWLMCIGMAVWVSKASSHNKAGSITPHSALGITTLHDPSNDTGEIFTQAELQKAGQVVGPRIYSTGTILYGAKGNFSALVNSLDDALTHLKRMKAAGAISVKVITSLVVNSVSKF